MAFLSQALTSLVTDALAWTSAILTQLNDNIDGHTHANGQGKPIISSGIEDASLVDDNIANASVTPAKLGLTVTERKAAGTLAIGTSTVTQYDDTGVEITTVLPVDSNVELHYKVFQFPAGNVINNSNYDLQIKDNGVLIASTEVIVGTDYLIGRDFVFILPLAAGSHLLTPSWRPTGSPNVAVAETLGLPRSLCLIEYGQ